MGCSKKGHFTRAGVALVGRDWSQLDAAWSKLKKAGFTPIVYGNGGQPLGATFYPWYDMSYMMIGAYPVTQWQGLYSGPNPGPPPGIKTQPPNSPQPPPPPPPHPPSLPHPPNPP